MSNSNDEATGGPSGHRVAFGLGWVLVTAAFAALGVFPSAGGVALFIALMVAGALCFVRYFGKTRGNADTDSDDTDSESDEDDFDR